MELSEIITYFLMAITALSAISIIFVRNVLYASLLLIVCLLALAGIYVVLYAEFIAITQILIYAGGVIVLLLFGIMLSSRIQGKPMMSESRNIFTAFVVGIGMFFLVTYCMQDFTAPQNKSSEMLLDNQVNNFGILIMTDWLIPFEIAGLLLLISLVGASVVAGFKNNAS